MGHPPATMNGRRVVALSSPRAVNMAKTQFRGWYYEQNGRKIGPVTTEAIAGLVALGVLKPTDRVWKASKGSRKTHYEAARAVLAVSVTRENEARKP